MLNYRRRKILDYAIYTVVILLLFASPTIAQEKSYDIEQCDSTVFQQANNRYNIYQLIDTSVLSNGIIVTESQVLMPLEEKGVKYGISKNDNEFETLSYIGFIKSLNNYVVHVSYPNTEQNHLIDKKSGLLIQTLKDIAPSGGRYLIAFDQPTSDSYFGIRILDKKGNNNHLKTIGVIKDNSWYPTDVVWASKNVFLVKATGLNKTYQNKYFKVTIKEQ